MSFENTLNKREIQLEHNDDIFGVLISKTVYSSYGIPLIYDLFNEKYRFLAYNYDNSDNEEFLFYIPLSIKEQEMIENKTLCLRGIIDSKPFYVISMRTEDGKIQMCSKLSSKDIKKNSLPKLGVYLEPEDL